MRLYLTVTEACNLRCAHCITDAPARTRSGRARTIMPWLLDALDESFAHADYVAFTHGGESLDRADLPRGAAPDRARAREPSRPRDVHLVTNGTLLDEERTSSLIDQGVTSLMVSLDGATAQTNDRIRVLGRFDRVVANCRAAVALRARRGCRPPDRNLDRRRCEQRQRAPRARSTVRRARRRLAQGRGDLPRHAVRARRSARARRRSMLAPAIAALRDVIAGRSLVLVDHLAPPTACTCSGDPARSRFAPRTTSPIAPCSGRVASAWEQAAIDPDGTVHTVDYAGAPLGSLLDAPMLALWNAPAALAARDRALAATSYSRRKQCIGHA